MAKLLQIDDDKVLCELLKQYLRPFDFDLIHTQDPRKALELFQTETPALVILDVMMPHLDGFSVMESLRKIRNTPVIMLTARGETTDRILGLEVGADDYISKPFEPRELVARIKAVLKRTENPKPDIVVSGDIRFDREKRCVLIGPHELILTSSEFDLLQAFILNPGKKFTRDELLSHLRGEDLEAYGRSIDNLVSRLRKKLSKFLLADPIHTLWGTGYSYVDGPKAKGTKT